MPIDLLIPYTEAVPEREGHLQYFIFFGNEPPGTSSAMELTCHP